MEDIFKNFNENLEKMSSVLDEREIADSIADRIFSQLNRDGNSYSKWNNFFPVADKVKKIEKSNLETLIQSKELIDTVSNSTVIFAHGELDINTFITVPKNTIILTFVEETRVFLDSGKLNIIDNPSKGDIFIFLFFKYLSKILHYSNKYINPINATVLYILIKKFIIKFIDVKNKFMNDKSLFNQNRSQRNFYRKYSDDFVAYYENDLIPNQNMQFEDLSITGIIPWDKYLDLSLSKSSAANKDVIHDYSDQEHPFYNIYQSVNKKFTQAVSNSKYSDLVRVLSEMKTRLDKVQSQKINIIILKTCRALDNLILKPQHTYFFKNLPATLLYRKKNTLLQIRN